LYEAHRHFREDATRANPVVTPISPIFEGRTQLWRLLKVPVPGYHFATLGSEPYVIS